MKLFISFVGLLHARFVKTRQVRRIVDYLVEVTPEKGYVLDIGCGSGEIARLLMQRKPGLVVHGIDIYVRENTHIPVTAFDGEHLPFQAKSFDVAMMVDVLHHADKQVQITKEAARVAREAVVIKDHMAENAIDRAILKFMDWVGNKSYGVRLPYNYLSLQQWQALFGQVGVGSLQKSHVKGLYPTPFSLLFERHLQVLFEAHPSS